MISTSAGLTLARWAAQNLASKASEWPALLLVRSLANGKDSSPVNLVSFIPTPEMGMAGVLGWSCKGLTSAVILPEQPSQAAFISG